MATTGAKAAVDESWLAVGATTPPHALMDAIEAFQAAHGGEWPKRRGHRVVLCGGALHAEADLGAWLAHCRASCLSGTLPPALLAALQSRWRQSAWLQHNAPSQVADAVDAFRLAHRGAWPSSRASAARTASHLPPRYVVVQGVPYSESALAATLVGLTRARAAGKLSAEWEAVVRRRWEGGPLGGEQTPPNSRGVRGGPSEAGVRGGSMPPPLPASPVEAEPNSRGVEVCARKARRQMNRKA